MKAINHHTKRSIAIILCSSLIILAAIGAWTYVQHQRSVQRDKQYQQQLKDDSFKKNAECQTYISGIQQEVDKNNQSQFAIRTETFDMIFYSQKDNSCLYVIESLGSSIREFFIYNALTSSKVTSFQFPAQFSSYKKFVLDYSGGEIRL